MPNEIRELFDASTAFTITLASLASTAARQSTIVDNTTNRYARALISVKIKNNATSYTANSFVEVYLLRDDNDGTSHRTDNAGASDAAITILNAPLIGVLRNANVIAGSTIYGEFVVDNLGPKWGIAILNRTGAALDATGTNHWARFVGINPEVG